MRKNKCENLCIVITGATSGIGEATAKYLVSKGYKVYSIARRKMQNTKIEYLQADVTNFSELEIAINKIMQKEGKIDCLINNAGIGISGAIECQDIEEIDKIINVNLKGVINSTKLALPYLRRSKGKIINIGSIAGELPIPFQTMYSMIKSAIHNYSLALSNELRPYGVKVSCVMPGDTKTSFTENREKNNIDSVYQKRLEKSVMKMEKDEVNGADPLKVAKVIYKCIKSKNPPLKIAVGFKYKVFIFLGRLLPAKLVNYILFKMYG